MQYKHWLLKMFDNLYSWDNNFSYSKYIKHTLKRMICWHGLSHLTMIQFENFSPGKKYYSVTIQTRPLRYV